MDTLNHVIDTVLWLPFLIPLGIEGFTFLVLAVLVLRHLVSDE